MRLIGFAVVLALSLCLAPHTGEAQQAGTVYRIGFLSAPPLDEYVVGGFRQGLREHGYVEGQNLLIEWRVAEGRYDRLTGFAAELVSLKVEVIVTVATEAALAAKKATAAIPIVFTMVPDPVALGLVPSLARPGMLKRHIRPTLGALSLPAITRGMVKDLLASKRASGLSKDSVRLIRATISALFVDAMDHELVTANPASKVGRGRGRNAPDTVTASERRQRVKAMSTTQLDTFLKAAARDRLADLWLFLVDTGVRPGEAFAFRRDDVDLVARTAHVHSSIERGSRRVKTTKTGVDRYVDLTPRLVKALDARQLDAEKKALESGHEAPDLVFPSDAGTILDGWNVAEVQVHRDAGRPAEVLDLRHQAHVRFALTPDGGADHLRGQTAWSLEANHDPPGVRPLDSFRRPRAGREAGDVAHGAAGGEARRAVRVWLPGALGRGSTPQTTPQINTSRRGIALNVLCSW
jgi:integrase